MIPQLKSQNTAGAFQKPGAYKLILSILFCSLLKMLDVRIVIHANSNINL